MSIWKRNWGDPSGRYLEVDQEKELETTGGVALGDNEDGGQVAERSVGGEELLSGAPLQEGDQLLQRFGKVRSALGEGTIVNGKLSFDAPVRIDGRLKGEIFSSKALIVGASGEIDANITVASLIVRGSVKGTIKATERIELLSGAELEGQVQTPILVVAEGSRFNGHCRVARANKVINVVIDGDRLDESAAQLQDRLKTSTGEIVAQPDKKK